MKFSFLPSFAFLLILGAPAAALAQGAPLQLQPPKPAGASSAAPAAIAVPAPAAAAINRNAAPPKVPTLDAATAIQKANAWFNGSPTLMGDFVQVGADGRRAEGKLYVQKPGRLRFDYEPPATLEIIADGTSVAIRDRKLATQDLYFISQTPLKFLLKDPIDIARDTKILNVDMAPTATTILVEDKATFGGTSRIKLVFDPQTFALKQWSVVDPQGYETLVSLFNLDLKARPPAELFKINMERFN